jgi:hypothetical protein
MSRLYDLLARNLHCCGCGCFIPLASFVVLSGGLGTWAVLS